QFRRTGIERRTVGIARPRGARRARLALRYQFCNLSAALETRIDQTLGGEPFQRIAILRKVLRLPPHWLLPGDAKPGEVFTDRSFKLRLAAGQVDILDAQQEPPAGLTRGIEIQQRR